MTPDAFDQRERDRLVAFLEREGSAEAMENRHVVIQELARQRATWVAKLQADWIPSPAFRPAVYETADGVVACRSCLRPMVTVDQDQQRQLYAVAKRMAAYLDYASGHYHGGAISANEPIFLARELARVLALIEAD